MRSVESHRNVDSFRPPWLGWYRVLPIMSSTGKVQAKHAARLKLILGLLNGATHADSMNAPELGFHPLKGKPKRWAVSVDGNFRVIFRFEDGHALEVDYDDYH
jgi:proteic killer suppression protein